MAGSVYYEQIEDTFEKVETAIEALPTMSTSGVRRA
ncbi:MAG: hypothetical protein CM15mP74_26430 [Halieaceae bacterium]|nr:MAG: hypothetical protein CM15mP74_26430 [Halieaceae bacterium]